MNLARLALLCLILALPVAPCAAADGSKSPADARIVRGDQQWAAGQLEGARLSFEQAVVADPRSVAARMKLGGFQLGARSYGAAIPTYQAAISLDPNNAKAWIGLGMAYLHTGQQDLSRAAFAEAVRIEQERKAQLAQLIDQPAR